MGWMVEAGVVSEVMCWLVEGGKGGDDVAGHELACRVR